MSVTIMPTDRDSGPVEVVRGVDHAFSFDVFKDDLPVAVTASPTITIRKGGTKHVNAASMTVTTGGDGATNNRLTYTWALADHPGVPTDDIIVEVVGTTTASDPLQWRFRLDAVRWGVKMSITEDDLFVRFPPLRDMRNIGAEEGTADSGDTTSLIDAKLAGIADDYYKGGEVVIVDGTNQGEARTITAFSGATGDVTVSPAWPSAIDTTSVYRVTRSWRPLIVEAWAEIRLKLRDRGARSHLIVDAAELRVPHLLLAGAMAFQSDTRGGVAGDSWAIGKALRDQADEWFSTRRYTYDVDDSGDPDSTLRAGSTIIARRA